MIPAHVSIIICVLYLASAGLFMGYLKTLTKFYLRIGRWLLTFGLMLHWGTLVAYFKQTGVFFPVSTPQSHLVVTAFLATGCMLLSARRSALFIIVLLLPMIAMSFGWIHWTSSAYGEIHLPSHWIWTHVLLMLLGEAFFCVAAASSVIYLVAESKLRQRSFSSLFSSLPPLPTIDLFLQELLWAGFAFLTVGFVMGILFAHQFWEKNWLLDPKVLFCALTWFWYAILIFLRKSSKKFWGRRSALLSVVGFVGVIFLSRGLHYVFPTQHENHDRFTEEK